MTMHGTRSMYNKGCRCDACREASRLARARQRAAARERNGESAAVADTGILSLSPWVLTAGLAGAAVWCFWRASQIHEDRSPGAEISRRRWILAAVGLTGCAVGLGYLARKDSPATGKSATA
jgi:hypothetical protein